MTISEIWLGIGISGFVLFMEGAITASFNIICFLLKRGKRRGVEERRSRSMLNRMILEHSSRAGVGLVLLIVAILKGMGF